MANNPQPNFFGKDFSTIASSSALVVSVGSTIYFYQRIGVLEATVNELKENLSKIIPLVDPKIATYLQQSNAGIKLLEQRINEIRQQAQVSDSGRMISGNPPPELPQVENIPHETQQSIPKPLIPQKSAPEAPKRYTRMTKKDSSPEQVISIPVMVNPRKSEEEEDPDIADAIAALRDDK
jgi:hypothetical protein